MSRRKPNHRRWLGREGEARAARFLEARGYRIVARNVRADRVEIDLIARRRGLLIFVEVKTRHTDPGMPRFSPRHGHAAEAVDRHKQQRIRHGAHAWLAAHPGEARRTRGRRFDVVTCLYEGRLGLDRASSETRNATTALDTARWSIEHWEAAF